MFNIALFEPKIPQNTGNIIRLSANNGCKLHLIGPLGFDLEEKNSRRSGLDYFDLANLCRHSSYDEFVTAMQGNRILALTTKSTTKRVMSCYLAQKPQASPPTSTKPSH